GVPLPFPTNAYQGDYVHEMARLLHATHNLRHVRAAETILRRAPSPEADPEAYLDRLIASAKDLLGTDYLSLHEFVLTEQLSDCRSDLLEFGVTFDAWFSEKSLFDSGLVERAI